MGSAEVAIAIAAAAAATAAAVARAKAAAAAEVAIAISSVAAVARARVAAAAELAELARARAAAAAAEVAEVAGATTAAAVARVREVATAAVARARARAADNGNAITVIPSTQFSFTGPKPGSTSPLASLATPTEPSNFSFNQQKTPVGTFPQRTSGGSPTANNGSPFGFSFSQASISGSSQPFQFNQTSATESPANFGNQSVANAPQFLFVNAPPDNAPNLSFKQTPGNSSQTQQPIGTFIVTPSTEKKEASNNKSQPMSSANNAQRVSTTSDVSNSTLNHTFTNSKRLSDPPTPSSEQSSVVHEEQEEADTPAGMAERSMIAKKVNTTLRDSNAWVVDRSDPNSPLYALKTFRELNLKPDLLNGIYNMGFQSPSKIQAIALPHLLDNPPRNIIAQAQSGTGKTATFSLAILSRIDPSVRSPQALILSPTFELALQIGSVIEQMAQFLPYIQIAYAVRDKSISKRSTLVSGRLLTEPIVIGTPGAVEAWCRKLRVINLSQLRMFCVDEARAMIATHGFQEVCVNIVNNINKSTCQMMLFSTTYSDEVMDFARQIVPNPAVLRVKREKQPLVNITQYFIKCYTPEQKYHTIEQIYAHITVGQAMIFCRTRATARELAVRMACQQHSVRELTAALDIEQSASIIKQFRDGIFRVLISTNVTVRGLDVDDLTLVINYDMPTTVDFQPDYEIYLRQIGCCGRFGRTGYAFNLIGSEKDYTTMKEIEQYFSHRIHEITIEGLAGLEEDQNQV